MVELPIVLLVESLIFVSQTPIFMVKPPFRQVHPHFWMVHVLTIQSSAKPGFRFSLSIHLKRTLRDFQQILSVLWIQLSHFVYLVDMGLSENG